MNEAQEAARKLFNAIAEAGRYGKEAFDYFETLVSENGEMDFEEGMEQLAEFF